MCANIVKTVKRVKYMENNESSFAERLKKIRIDNGISQNELSNYLGITSSSLSYYENGLRTPPITILSKLTNRFNVSVNWLLGLEEPEDTELKTYADMIKLLISLLDYSNIWKIELKNLDRPFDNVFFDGIKTEDRNITRFLREYKQMLEIVNNVSTPTDLFKTWLDSRVKTYESINLPYKNED